MSGSAGGTAVRLRPRAVQPLPVPGAASRPARSYDGPRTSGVRDRLRSPFALRTAMLTVVALLSLLQGRIPLTLPWVAALGVVLAASSRPRAREFEAALITVEVAVAAVGALVTGGATSPLLAYLPAATLIAGWAYGATAALVTACSECALLLLGAVLHPRNTGAPGAFPTATVEFAFLALVVGLLAARTRSGERAATEVRQYAEANRLLSQLREVARDLPGSLDPGSVADLLLDRLEDRIPTARSAVLVRVGASQLAPVSCRGIHRVPWRDPAVAPGPLRTCLETGQPVLDARTKDAGGRRAGSTLLVLPMRVDGRTVGLVALETAPGALAAGDVPELARMADAGALALDTALLFDELRSTASLEERERLAQEIHDGVAQDLAFLGYEIDSLRRKLPSDAAAHAQAVRLRGTLNDLVGELRVSIADLRTSIRADRGLTAVLTSYVRGIAGKSGLAVHLTLSESGFRLPGDVEVQLFRIAQDVITRARRDPTAANLWVELAVEPPGARLVLEHDGRSDGTADLDPDLLATRAAAIGASVRVLASSRGGSRLEVRLSGDVA